MSKRWNPVWQDLPPVEPHKEVAPPPRVLGTEEKRRLRALYHRVHADPVVAKHEGEVDDE